MELKQIEIDKIIFGGNGLGFLEGKAHFVPGVLPGEIVEVEVLEEKRGYNICSLKSVIKKSDTRVEPFCKYYNDCGGCNMQHTTYANQIEIKKSVIKDVFKRNGKIELDSFNIVPSPDKSYRNRIQFHLDGEKKGFKKRQSNKIIDINECPILTKGLNNFIKESCEIKSERVTVFGLDEAFYVGGVDKECKVTINGRDVWFNPAGFFQSNLSILPELINRVNSFVTGGVVMDLYCGVGLFSVFLPDTVQEIIAVEMDSRVKPFVEKNLESKKYSFYPFTLESYIKRGLNKKNRPETIIVDPPRKGLSEDVRRFLVQSGAKRILYVSCDPVTMARDIGELTNKEFDLTYYESFDFYPQTHHIESFCVLER